MEGWLKSKTMRVATLTAMVGALITGMPMIKDSVSIEVYGFTMVILGVIFAGLRTVTTKDLKDL